MKSGVYTAVDNLAAFLKAAEELSKQRVMVGIPAEKASRKAEPGEKDPPSNAALGYIHEHGAPEVGIPPRPFLVPGVRLARQTISAELKMAGLKTLEGNAPEARKFLNRAGITAQNAVRKKITDGPFIPLKPETIANRFRKRKTKTRREGELKYLDLIAKGVSPAEAQAAVGIKPLIDTGQLRAAISYVIRRKF